MSGRKYIVLCSLLGLPLGWLPRLLNLHGPIPEKFDLYGLNGSVLVWAYYLDRLLIGFLVGITVWPRAWYLRGPVCGLVLMLPIGFVSLANAYCGPP